MLNKELYDIVTYVNKVLRYRESKGLIINDNSLLLDCVNGTPTPIYRGEKENMIQVLEGLKSIKELNLFENKLNELQLNLIKNGYSFLNNGYCIEISLSNYKVVIWETIQDTLYFRILDYKGNVVFKKCYKTVRNLIKCGLNNEYLKED